MSKPVTIEEIISKQQSRSVNLLSREATINEGDRTVELSFSSDEPVCHWFGYLILDHSAGSARLDRINSSGALLWMHDRRTQIGSVSNVRLDADNKGRALAKFSRGSLGEEKFQDVKDEICRTVSFGFSLYSLEAEVGNDGKQKMIDGEPVYRSRDWEPFEVSLEPIPADTSVGIGRDYLSNFNSDTKTKREERDLKLMEKKMEKKDEIPTGEQTREQTQAPAAPAAVVENTDVIRARSFRQYGEEFGEVELARDMALDPTKTLADVGKAIIAKRAANQPKIEPPAPENVAERQGQQVVLARGVHVGNLKAFRGANAQADAYRSGMSLLAALENNPKAIEYCRTHGIDYSRTQSGTDNAKGGVFVIPEFESAIIDLRIEYGAFRRNAMVTPMSSDTKVINRRTGGLTAYPVGSGQSGTGSDATWDQIELIARKWMVLAKMEDELSEDSVISFADTLANEIAYAFTYAEDNAGFNGDGSGAYHGIVGVIQKLLGVDSTIANIKGLKVASGNQWSEITEADLLGVIGLLPQFARKSGMVKWFCSHTFWANVLQRIALAKGGVSYAEINGELKEVFMGKPVEIVEVMPTTEANSQIPLLYGNMNQAATMGDRRGVTVKMTDSNDKDFEKDVQTIKGTERFDINVHDVGSTTAAGPLVGLITAAS